MPTEFDAPEQADYPDMTGVPEDVTMEEMAGAVLRDQPIIRNGEVVVDKIELTDQMIKNMMAGVKDELDAAGIELVDEDYLFGDEE